MIQRTLTATLHRLARGFPVLTLTGPRQSGKTTLCKAAFPEHAYVSLEPPDTRRFAQQDPRGFLANLTRGTILDEIQRAPELTSYLQSAVDEDPTPGRFILTGSEHLAVTQATSQSLAGRSATVHLFPLDRAELRCTAGTPAGLSEALFKGGYPALYDRDVTVADWLSSYRALYVERDVRQLLRIADLGAFQTFMGLCAGRAGSLLNLSALGADAGVSHNTAKAWISVLEASFLTFRLRPWHRSLGKRLVRRPKLYFWDTGLLCNLLGIQAADQLRQHPLRGAVFENFVVAELAKASHHRGQTPAMTFYRDQRQLEIDVLLQRTDGVTAVEAKSGQTIGSDFFAALNQFAALRHAAEKESTRSVLVYGGEEGQSRSAGQVVSWRDVDRILGS